MQIFELHFNPRAKEDVIFDTFYYEPEDIYERRLGHLFMAGELISVLPQNVRFLKNLARVIKTKFYSLKTHLPPDSLKESLKEANSFLEKIAKEGDVSWISNLNFAILSLSPKSVSGTKKVKTKKYRLNFTKVGDIKVFLIRGGKVLDIGENLEFKEIEPYPLKIFFNIVSGKIEQGDRILIMTGGISETFLTQDIIEQIAKLPYLNERNLSQVLKDVKRDVLGICLLINLEIVKEMKFGKKLIFKEKILDKKFKGVFKGAKRVKALLAPARSKIQLSLSKASLRKIPLPKFPAQTKILSRRLPRVLPKKLGTFSGKLARVKPLAKTFVKKKNIILISSLFFLLLLGGFLATNEENRRTAQIQLRLKTIQEKLDEVNVLLLSDQQKQANDLLLGILNEIQPLTKEKGALTKEISQMEEDIEAKLFDLNKLEIIEAPELIFEFEKEKFLPQKIIFSDEKIYFFSPYSENIFELNREGEIHLFETKAKFNDAVLIDNTILFFSKPDQFLPFQDGGFGKEFSLKLPFEGFGFESPSSFKSNLYFLDKKTGQIIKYKYLGNLEWQDPEFWLNEQTKKATDIKSMTIDGLIWLLRGENLIDKYYTGDLQETIIIEIFPYLKDPTKIWTASNLPYLYILEPGQKRIIILDKQGQIVKQYQSEKFDNLKDFSVSEDGKKIYLLNGSSLYQIIF